MKEKPLLTELGSYLRQKRLESNLSQMDVAKELGYSTFQMISAWERGICSPPAYAIKPLATLFNISPTEIYEIHLKCVIEVSKKKLADKYFRYEKKYA